MISRIVARYQFEATDTFAADQLPDFVSVLESPLDHYSPVPEGVRARLHESYTLRTVIEGVGELKEGTWYGQLAAFFAPFVGAHHIVRPGPNVFIYERRSALQGE